VAGAGVADITVNHLLQHRAGWAADYSWSSIAIAAAIEGVDSPPGLTMTTRWAMAQDLAETPGDVYDYSNFGYNVLTLIIEELTGQSFIGYLESKIMTPNEWVPSTEIYGGLPFYSQRGPREPEYIAEGSWTSVPNVFDPDGPNVPWTYGGFDIQSTYGSSGLVMSTVPLLAFLHKYCPDRNWTPGGSMPGTSSIIRAREDDIGIVVLTNERGSPGDPFAPAAALTYGFDQSAEGRADEPVHADAHEPSRVRQQRQPCRDRHHGRRRRRRGS
jgi:CubicO group peptidase (beta-lactamase class C family)